MTPGMPPILDVAGLVKHYPPRSRMFAPARHPVVAVDGVSFKIGRGEVVGLVGESGSGKSTIGRMVVRLAQPTDGQILFDGLDITDLPRRALTPVRRRLQMAFQNSTSSLDPMMSVEDIVGEALTAHRVGSRAERRAAVIEVLARVGLSDRDLARRPASFSGGQRARIGLARALVLRPDLLVADEPTAALDASVQAQIVNLLDDLRHEFGLSMLLITHDIGVVDHLCDRVLVLYRGRIVEAGPVDDVLGSARHPYTAALIAAVPSLHGAMPRQRRPALAADLAAGSSVAGCAFRSRCPIAIPRCAVERPDLHEQAVGHAVACLRTGSPATTHSFGIQEDT